MYGVSRCSYCGIGEGMHISGCPGIAKAEPYWIQERERKACKDCGWKIEGEHYSTCPQHPRNIKKDKPVQPKPPDPDTYVSPHSVDAEAAMRKYVQVPVFEEVYSGADGNGGMITRLVQRGTKYEYPHKDWLDARDQFAKDGTWESLNAMLQHVTETNPPPGPAIPVYKAPAKDSNRARTLFYAAFALCFCVVGLYPLLVMLFG